MSWWPFVSRSAHEAITSPMEVQIEELKTERKLLLDRLGVLGLGGPLFTKVEPPDEPEEEEKQELVDPDELIKRIRALRGNPRAQRAEIRRQAAEAERNKYAPPSVARIPDPSKVANINAAMDAAEAQGRRKA